MNKILITGASGFVGRVLVKKLLAENIPIRALVRDGSALNIQHPLLELHQGDLTHPDTLTDLCQDIDTVFHLGGYSHALKDTDDTAYLLNKAINIEGTQHLLKEAIKSGVKKFIYVSSVKATADSNEWIDETFTALPDNSYGLAKRQAESSVLDAGKKHPIHVCVIRPTLVYGPHWKGNLEKMMQAIERGYFIPPPNVDNIRSMVSVNDLCQALLLAANNPIANGKIYIVADDKGYSTKELYDLMCRSLGKKIPCWHLPMIGFKALAKFGDIFLALTKRKFIFDSYAMEKLFTNARYRNNLIKAELHFTPQDTLDTCLPDIIATSTNKEINS